MAVAHKKDTKKRASFLGKILKGTFGIAILAWILLLSMEIFIWATADFGKAYHHIKMQAMTISRVTEEFGGAEFLRKLSQHTLNQFDLSSHINFSEELKALQNNEVWQTFSNPRNRVSNPSLENTFSDVGLKAKQFWLLLKAITHLIFIKAIVLMAAIPLFLLALIAGLIDGLNQRAIRTSCLGRESTYVFHKSVPIVRKILFWVLIVWLALPLSVAPSVVFISLSVLLSWVVSISASRFKKYL